jgi:hypothetical protein
MLDIKELYWRCAPPLSSRGEVLINKKLCENNFLLSIITITFVTITFLMVWITITIFGMDKEISNFYSEGLVMYLITNGLLVPYIVFINKKCLEINQNDLIFKNGLFNRSIYNIKEVNIQYGSFFSIPYVDFNTERVKIRFFSLLMSKKDFAVMKTLEKTNYTNTTSTRSAIVYRKRKTITQDKR